MPQCWNRSSSDKSQAEIFSSCGRTNHLLFWVEVEKSPSPAKARCCRCASKLLCGLRCCNTGSAVPVSSTALLHNNQPLEMFGEIHQSCSPGKVQVRERNQELVLVWVLALGAGVRVQDLDQERGPREGQGWCWGPAGLSAVGPGGGPQTGLKKAPKKSRKGGFGGEVPKRALLLSQKHWARKN